MNLTIKIVTLALPILLASCASYGPYHPNTSAEPLNSVRGPTDGRYKLAFIEFGDQGSALDTSQRAAALGVIHEAKRPLLFVYIHGWHNDANSADVCRFEHFIDTVSRFPEITGRKSASTSRGAAGTSRCRDSIYLHFGVANMPVEKLRRKTPAWRPSTNWHWPPERQVRIFTIASCLAILLAAWCLRTPFLIPSLMLAAPVHAIAAHGTWPWRLIRRIVPSAAGNCCRNSITSTSMTQHGTRTSDDLRAPDRGQPLRKTAHF